MLLFKREPAEEHHKLGLRHRDINSKEHSASLAIQHFQEAIKLNPNEVKHRFELGRTYLLLPELAVLREQNLPFKLSDSTQLALAEFEEVVRLNPKYDPAYLNMAHCNMILGNKKKAVSYFEQYLAARRHKVEKVEEHLQNLEYALLKRKKRRPDAKPVESEQHLRKAIQLRSMGKYRQAEIEFEKSREIAPDYRWFYQLIYKLVR